MPSNSTRNDVLQIEEHGENMVEDQDNDPMEEDDNNNIVQDVGTNQLIQNLYDDDIYDAFVLQKAWKSLYEGSRENILSATLLLVNLKVLNGLSNTCMTQILSYNVICFINT